MLKIKFWEIYTMETFKDRLAHILRSKNLTGSQFAGLMGIQPSNVSHLLSGRNNPSLDFLMKLKETFPEYSFDWIILGKKPITMVEPVQIAENQEVQTNFDIVAEDDIVEKEEFGSNFDKNPDTSNIKRVDFQQSDVTPQRILIMYEDHTFELYDMRK